MNTQTASDTLTLAKQCILSGHSCSVLGQPGTGKTRLLLEVANEFRSTGKQVTITASTGIASVSIGGKTLHRFAGIGDGTFTRDQVINRMKDDSHILSRERIIVTDTLLIDEISMISSKSLLDVEFILRKIRNNDRPFGGMQVVVFGDFYQLKPVADYNDPGDSVIQPCCIDAFLKIIPHQFVLTTVHRQSENNLVRAIHSLCKGEVSPEVEQFMASLSHDEIDGATKLFARNHDVEIVNSQELLTLEGEMKVYTSQDTGDKKRLSKLVQAVKYLHVKINCSVSLTANINDTLVNGLRGHVIDTTNDSIVVRFENLQTVAIERYSFTCKGYGGLAVACRKQFPLRLAYAFTVHRAQGMSLDKVAINCRLMHMPGQLGVALGRARTVNGISVTNFQANKIQKQPDYIQMFYDSPSLPIADNLICCVNKVVKDPPTVVILTRPSTSDTPDLEAPAEQEPEEEPEEVSSIAELDQAVLNCLVGLKYADAVTSNQINLNSLVDYLSDIDTRDKRSKFVLKIWRELTTIYYAKLALPTLANKDATAMYRCINAYITSEHYNRLVAVLMEGHPSTQDTQRRVCYEIVEQLRLEKIKKAVDELRSNTETVTHNLDKHLDHHGEANIRYIAGWCIGRLTKAKRQIVKRNLYNANGVNLTMNISNQIHMLEDMVLQLSERDSSDPSLARIQRKEYSEGMLTVVNDDTFKFFASLDRKIQQLETEEKINTHGSNLYIFITDTLNSDPELATLWEKMNSSPLDDSSVSLKCEVFEKYITFSAGSFVKQFKQMKNVKRKFEHRKQIHVTTQKQAKTTPQVQFPCAVCNKECNTRVVLCETCDRWHHYKCVGLKGKEAELAEDAPAWICLSCRSKL